MFDSFTNTRALKKAEYTKNYLKLLTVEKSKGSVQEKASPKIRFG